MKNELNSRCEVRMYNGNVCGRPLYSGSEHCIFHTADEYKDANCFNDELNNLLEGHDRIIDCTRFVFPNIRFRFPASIRNPIIFSHAVFNHKANFFLTTFNGGADFSSVEFLQGASFSNSKFYKFARFRNAKFNGKTQFLKVQFDSSIKTSEAIDFKFCEFHGTSTFIDSHFHVNADFRSAKFCSDISFYHCIFYHNAKFVGCHLLESGMLLFDGETPDGRSSNVFFNECSLTEIRLEDSSKLIFRKLSLENCTLLETDVTSSQFIDISWPSVKQQWGKTRHGVKDEIVPDALWLNWEKDRSDKRGVEPPKFQYDLIAQLYRRLQANYTTSYHFSEAGNFHVGEQEMMRKSKGKIRQFFCTNFLYKLASNYGESYMWPLFWIAILIILFPVFFLYGGVDMGQYTSLAGKHPVEFDWSWDPRNILFTNAEYWKTFCINSSAVAYGRVNLGQVFQEPYQFLLLSIERILILTLATFFVLALRRKFKRKSF